MQRFFNDHNMSWLNVFLETLLCPRKNDQQNECALFKSQTWYTNQDDFFFRYMIKRLNQTNKINDVIRALSLYLKKWIANNAAFFEKQKWLITKIQRRLFYDWTIHFLYHLFILRLFSDFHVIYERDIILRWSFIRQYCDDFTLHFVCLCLK